MNARFTLSKTETYECLSAMNQYLQLALEHLKKLAVAKVIPHNVFEIHRLTIEETRSEVNHAATIALHDREAKNAYWFEKRRLALEGQMEKPSIKNSRLAKSRQQTSGASPRKQRKRVPSPEQPNSNRNSA